MRRHLFGLPTHRLPRRRGEAVATTAGGKLLRARARPRRLLALFAILAVAATACGTRVPDREIRAALAGASSGRAAQTGVGGGPLPGSGGGSASGKARPGGSGHRASGGGRSFAAGGGGSGSGSGTAGSSRGRGGSRSRAGSGGGSCAGGSTDVGVTRTSILAGASYAESSLIPGQFRPAIDAVRAYFDMVNRGGGVCGRRLYLRYYNDGLNANTYEQNVRHLVDQDKVFALLGSLSAADSGGCNYMGGQRPPRGVPDIGTFALSYCRAQAPNHYGPVGSLKPGIYGCCEEWQFLESRFHFHKPAVHYLDVQISRDEGLEVVDALVRTLHLPGRGRVYQSQHSPAQFDYTGDVVNMRNAGVDGVWSSMDLNNDVKLVRAICQQGWHPKVIHLEISAYDPQFVERVGGSCISSQNIWMRSVFPTFGDPNREIQLYVHTLRSFCGSCQPSIFGMEGWLSAKLFVEQVDRVGGQLTRARLFGALNSVRNWTGGGVMGPVTPSQRIIYHCNYMIHVVQGGFSRQSGLLCGHFYRSGDYHGGPVA